MRKVKVLAIALVALLCMTCYADACPLQQQAVVGQCYQQQAVAVQQFVQPQYVQQFAVQPVVQAINVQPQLIVRQRVVQQVVRPVRQRIVVRTGGIF